jgi:hypothetical protein
VLPLVWQALDDVALRVPVDVVEWLRRHRDDTASKNIRATGRLTQIVECLEREPLDVLTFKGPTLAALAYRDLGLRAFSDLDLLVKPDDVPRALELLRTLGYQPDADIDPAHLPRIIEVENAFAVRAPNGQLVEVHWALTPKSFRFRHDLDRVWDRAIDVDIAGRRVRTLPAAHLLLFLCVHAAKHCWESLGWIVDIARLIDAVPIDYDEVRTLAAHSGTERILMLGLLLAHDLGSAPVPGDLVAIIRRDRVIDTLARDICRHIGAESRRMMAVRQRVTLQWRMRERLRDRVLSGMHLALTPTVRDFSKTSLTARLPLLQRPMRPIRLLRDYAGRDSKS